MNTAAPIVAAPVPGWVTIAKSALRRSIPEFRRAIGLDATGQPSDSAWREFADALTDSLASAMAGGFVAIDSERDRETRFETGRVRIGNDPTPGAFDEAIGRLESRVAISGGSMDAIWGRARDFAQRIVNAERSTGAAGLVDRLRAVIERAERSFAVKGATAAQSAKVRDTIAAYMRDIGKPFDRQRFGEWSAVLRPIQQQLGVGDNRADTIVRTNTLRSYNTVHAERLERPDVRRVIPLVMLVEIHDRRTRGAPDGIYADGTGDNPGWHWQMDGLVGTIEQFRAWGVVPPNGYRCRASIRGLTLAECEEMGFLDAATLAIDMRAVHRYNGRRLKIIAAGLYPDRGFRKAA